MNTIARHALLRSVHRRLARTDRLLVEMMRKGLAAMSPHEKGRKVLEKHLAEEANLGALLERLRQPVP